MKRFNDHIVHASARQGVLWNAAANLCNAAHSVLMLAFVSRFCGNEEAGVFSLSFSFAQMMYLICCFELPNILITDSEKKFGFSETVLFRVITNAIMIIFAVVFGILQRFSGLTMAAFALLTLHMLLLSLAELCESHLHRSNYLNLSGKSLTFDLILCNLSFAFVLFFTQKLTAAIVAMCCVTFLWLLFVDIPLVRVTGICQKTSQFSAAAIKSLFKLCLPLLCMRLIMSYIINSPKLAIDTHLTSTAQSYFGYMLMPASCINLLSLFALKPQLVNLAYSFEKKERLRFLRIVAGLFLWNFLVTVCVLIGGFFLGIPILSAFYGSDLSGMEALLCIILLGGSFYAFATLLDTVTATMRCHQWNLLTYVPVLFLSFLMTENLVQKYGLIGAGLSYMLLMMLLAIGSGLVFALSVKQKFVQGKK